MIRYFYLAILVVAFPIITLSKDCTVDQIYDSCDKLNVSGPILRIDQDGSVVPNLYRILGATDEEKKDPLFSKEVSQIISSPKNNRNNQEKLKKMMDFIRESYIEIALRGRKENDPHLDPSTKSIILRLRKLEIAKADEKEESCDQMIANAFYHPSEHIIKICNGLAKGPDLMLLFITAHEVGHSIDSCRLSTALVEISPDIKTKGCKERLTSSENPEVLSARAGKVVSVDEFSTHAATIEKCKFGKIIASGQENLGNNSIADTVNCVLELDGKKSAAPMQSLEDFLKMARIQLKEQHPDLNDVSLDQTMTQAHSVLVEGYEKYKSQRAVINQRMMGCGTLAAMVGNPNSSAERSADTLAAQIVKKYLQKNQLTDEQKKSLIEFQAQISCGYKLSDGKKFTNPLYPVGEERANILFQESEVQKTLNCKYPGVEKCSLTQIENKTSANRNESAEKKKEAVR